VMSGVRSGDLTAYKEAVDVEDRGAGWVLFAGIMLFLAGS
jgi:hypothetical protein